MDAASVCPRPVLQRDAEALIGLLAIVEGEAMVSRLDAGFVDHLSRRFVLVGLMADGATGGSGRHSTT